MKYIKILLIFIAAFLSLAPTGEKPKEASNSQGGAKEREAPPERAKASLYEKIRGLAFSLSKEKNWSKCMDKIMCSKNFNAQGEIGWKNSSSPNKLTQTYVCNINADGLFNFITGKSANIYLAKEGVTKTTIDSAQDSGSNIKDKIETVFKKTLENSIHHMVIMVHDIPHFLIILQEKDKISLFQSFSAKLPNNPKFYCSYSLRDYLTKNSSELYSNIILEKETSQRSSLLEELNKRDLIKIVKEYLDYKTLPISFLKQDLNNLFKGKELLSTFYQRLFVCPLPDFFEKDYFAKKGISNPRVWISIQSTKILDEDFSFFRESLLNQTCEAKKSPST